MRQRYRARVEGARVCRPDRPKLVYHESGMAGQTRPPTVTAPSPKVLRGICHVDQLVHGALFHRKSGARLQVTRPVPTFSPS